MRQWLNGLSRHTKEMTEGALDLKGMLAGSPWTSPDLRIKAPLTRRGVCGHQETDGRAGGVKERAVGRSIHVCTDQCSWPVDGEGAERKVRLL